LNLLHGIFVEDRTDFRYAKAKPNNNAVNPSIFLCVIAPTKWPVPEKDMNILRKNARPYMSNLLSLEN
jgi:hypothetical protein